MKTTLSVSTGTSKGKNTYGWATLTLTDEFNGKKYRQCGGGCSLLNLALADYLNTNFKARIAMAKQDYPGQYGLEINENGAYIEGGVGGTADLAKLAGITVTDRYTARGKFDGFDIEWNPA